MLPVHLSAGRHGRLTIGDRTFVNQGVGIHAEVDVRIGNHVRIGDLCAIYDTNFHGLSPTSTTRVEPVVIEDGVWLARNVTVLPGSHIGAKSVVGAGVVVSGFIPPSSLVKSSRPQIRRL